MTARRRAGAGGCLAAALVLVLAGCVPDSGGVPGRLERGLASADSNAQTASLALRELSAGRTTPQQAHTAIDDALTKLGEERAGLAGVEPATPAERRWRSGADDAIGELDAALKDARAAVAGGAGIRWSQARREVADASDALEHARRTIIRQGGEAE
ncbi:hypothetical protein [Gryllotalpicola protaetiae]|uniref:DUF4398 domain-containing protein n=1 Tax=Gryllotalpicola protaetiae TaxID=2419771 RepID=A0A387BTW0_9MICO|nr:hypothetical protein [Gryllotalpicola protaetiae]AYG04377.1 hypothetical protein D7I44_13135 [Gryllotalpicola protaetiae]